MPERGEKPGAGLWLACAPRAVAWGRLDRGLRQGPAGEARRRKANGLEGHRRGGVRRARRLD